MLKSFFRWIFRIKPKVIDPWEGDGTNFYVYNFREHLDVIAKTLSLKALKGQIVCTRLNVGEKCAELHYCGGDVIAQVRAYGEVGTPYEVVVTFSSLPLEEERMLFILILPIRVEFAVRQKIDA